MGRGGQRNDETIPQITCSYLWRKQQFIVFNFFVNMHFAMMIQSHFSPNLVRLDNNNFEHCSSMFKNNLDNNVKSILLLCTS